jgi:hypothetical protein
MSDIASFSFIKSVDWANINALNELMNKNDNFINNAGTNESSSVLPSKVKGTFNVLTSIKQKLAPHMLKPEKTIEPSYGKNLGTLSSEELKHIENLHSDMLSNGLVLNDESFNLRTRQREQQKIPALNWDFKTEGIDAFDG